MKVKITGRGERKRGWTLQREIKQFIFDLSSAMLLGEVNK